MTARLMTDRRKLSDEERKAAYKNRFRPGQALPDSFELGRPPRPAPQMKGGEYIKALDPKDIQPRDLVAYARQNSLPVLERLYEISMMDIEGAKDALVVIEACGQFLNRAGLYEVKGAVALIHAKVQGRLAQEEEAERIAKTVDVEKLTDGLGPKGPML